MICVQSILIKVSWICLLIYVDDILMASKYNKATDETANLIGKTVQLKYYLGIQVDQDTDEVYSFNQQT